MQGIFFCLLSGALLWASKCAAFEGQILAVGGRVGAVGGLIYTVGTNLMRVEMTDTNFPNPVDVVELSSGQITLIQPMNATFLRFKPGARNSPGFPGMPSGLPPGTGQQTQPGFSSGAPPPPQQPQLPPGIGPTNFPGMPGMPAGLPPGIGPQVQAPGSPGSPAVSAMQANPGMRPMPAMPMIPPGGGLQLQATSETTNLFNYTCERYEIKQRGETMEIWATDQLLPFQAYLANQPPTFGPPMIEFQWSALLSASKLFPLHAILRADNGVERYRFEVQSITPRRLTDNEIRSLGPPDNYVEIQPRPF